MNGNEQLYDIADELIILPKAVLDIFLKSKKPADLISLYTFYYYTAKWQKTNRPKCTTSYVSNGLKWGDDKVRRVKKELVKIGLIKDVTTIDAKTKKVKGWYIKINYIFKRETVDNIIETHPSEKPECGKSHSVETRGTNALSSNNINALSSNNKEFPKELENNIFIKTWKEWLQHRKEIKKKLTPSQMNKQLKFLLKRKNEFNEDPTEIINNSIMNGWVGLFQLSNKGNNKQQDKTFSQKVQDNEIKYTEGF